MGCYAPVDVPGGIYPVPPELNARAQVTNPDVWGVGPFENQQVVHFDVPMEQKLGVKPSQPKESLLTHPKDKTLRDPFRWKFLDKIPEVSIFGPLLSNFIWFTIGSTWGCLAVSNPEAAQGP